VRQFINRIASLGNGFEDFTDAQAQTFVGKVLKRVLRERPGEGERA